MDLCAGCDVLVHEVRAEFDASFTKEIKVPFFFFFFFFFCVRASVLVRLIQLADHSRRLGQGYLRAYCRFVGDNHVLHTHTYFQTRTHAHAGRSITRPFTRRPPNSGPWRRAPSRGSSSSPTCSSGATRKTSSKRKWPAPTMVRFVGFPPGAVAEGDTKGGVSSRPLSCMQRYFD